MAHDRNHSVFVEARFGVHIPTASMDSMKSGMAAYGNVKNGPTERELVVEIYRTSKLPQLKEQLTKWETFGFLQWDIATPSD
jgi:hypothetical protein